MSAPEPIDRNRLATEPPQHAAPGAGQRILAATVAYFIAMLSVSWLIAPVREFFVSAGADPVLAMLSQATLTLLFLTFASGWAVAFFSVPKALASRLAVGFGAVACLLVADTLTAEVFYDVGPLPFLSHLWSPDNAVVGLTLCIAGVLPTLRGRRDEVS